MRWAANAQSIIASVIPPRQRGHYSGYLGAVMAVASLALLQRYLRLTTTRRRVKLDGGGALLSRTGSRT